ncbi:uncharacterized protein J3D65DRAFT_606028 [Phyllosticta citribraziliensis]|uniref:Uncharacterized protein n=1 Tax=Phyllosticta citribraziliensis TaxID=989973 RepID=A0ABR1L9Z3_9PEZI
MKLLVNIPPLPPAIVGTLGPPPPKPEPKRFGVNVLPNETFGDIWPRIDDSFKRLYPNEYLHFAIKKLQVLGCDVAYDEKVWDWFEGETDRSKQVVEVIRQPIDRNISVAPTSFLRPPNLLKRTHLAAIDENAKRRRIDEEQYGVAIEDMLPDRPIRSREHDTEGLRPGSRATSGANSDVVVVADSQREAVPWGAPRDATSTKTESPDRTSLMDVPEAVPGAVAAEANGLHPNPGAGVFRKPGLPASASKDTAGAPSVRRSATPRRRKKSVPITGFPPRPPWNPSPSPSTRSRRESPNEPAPDSLPVSQRPEHRSEHAGGEPSFDVGRENNNERVAVRVSQTPTPTQPDSLAQALSFIPPGGEAPTSSLVREPSAILGTPPSAQRPPRSPDGSRSQASSSKPVSDDHQAAKSLERRRHQNAEPSAADPSSQQSSQPALSSPAKRSADKRGGAETPKKNGSSISRSRKSTGAIQGESVIDRGAAARGADKSRSRKSTGAIQSESVIDNEPADKSRRSSNQRRKSSAGDSNASLLRTEVEEEPLRKLKRLNDGRKIYEDRKSKFTPLEDEALILGRQAGLEYAEISKDYLPNRSYKSLRNRYFRLQDGGDNVSQISEPSVETTPRTQSNPAGSSPHVPTSRKDSQASQGRQSSSQAAASRKDSQASQGKQPSSQAPVSRKDSHSSRRKHSSPEVRIPAPSQPARKADALPFQTSSEPRSSRQGGSSLAKSTRKPDSGNSKSSQDVSDEMEKLAQKYVKKLAEKAEAERKIKACLDRQIKAKNFRDRTDERKEGDKRRRKREASEKKEVARLRQLEQDELRRFRANLFICEQAGLVWAQSEKLLESDPNMTPDEVRGKLKTYGSSKPPIHNHVPDSEHDGSLSRLRPRRTTRSVPSVADGAGDRRQSAEHVKQRQSLPNDDRSLGATTSRVKDSSIRGKEAAKAGAGQITEPVEIDVVSSTSGGPAHGQAIHGQAIVADDSDSPSDDQSITSPEPEQPTMAAASTQRKKPTVKPLEFQSEELGHDLNPASFVPSSPSDASDIEDAPPSSPPVLRSPLDEDRLARSPESSSSESEESSYSDSEASSEEEEPKQGAVIPKTNGVKSNGINPQSSATELQRDPRVRPPAEPRPAPKSPGARFRDPRIKNLSELKAEIEKERAPIPKPVVVAPPKNPQPVEESSSDDDYSSSDGSTDTDSSVERRKKERRAKSNRKAAQRLQRSMFTAPAVYLSSHWVWI